MANDTTDTPPDSVQCPVCFKDFNSDSINGHLDECLLKGDTARCLLPDGGGPPGKKFCSEAPPHFPDCGDHQTAPSTSLGVFSMFHGNKKKVSLQNDTDASFTNKHAGGNKGVKRSLPAEPETVCLGTRKKNDGQTLNAAQTLSLRTLMTSNKPLAALLRPNTLEEYFGQSKVVGQETLMRFVLDSQEIPSLILWGPPGCGKTTLAHIIASTSKKKGTARFVTLSATSSSTAEVREVIKQAENELRLCKRRTILFVDEIHRFNKSQQDTFLPHVECGTVTLIGATTENPSFQVNSALLSRCRVLVLEKLSVEAMGSILERAVAALGIRVLEQEQSNPKHTDPTDENKPKVFIEQKAMDTIAYLCDGDARAGLNSLQLAVQAQGGWNRASPFGPDDSPKEIVVKEKHVKEGLQRSHVLYDKAGEEHYNCISALHKSMRGSHENAALYWLGRMLEGGEDPLYVARRLISFASEDVGMADPLALSQAVSTFQACHFIGMPQCEVNLAQCVVYLSRAPKSMEVHMAYNNVKACLRNHKGPMPPVPLHLRNASSRLMKQLGYGKGYIYDSNVEQEFLPEELRGINFFTRTNSSL
ncbi:ATPase WRNIP1 isoform X1 [Entelurus aequoreus]|uniref:ATPase WRNIP1 isoform X1 n=1 Tax=Entelurus aequoreus TaxID=161455 RepID=UPI002B1DB96C|nr:ATPase WRNIP1 isoform X1 [Entelurus aequoreus]XP_061878538.1 ATPase WRNIP1 isoform X1 [Entelurus aequoreus]